MYGISNSVMQENTLHGQIDLEREMRQGQFNQASETFKKNIKDTRGRDTSTNEDDTASNVSDIQKAYNVGTGLKGAVQGSIGEVSAGLKAGRSTVTEVAQATAKGALAGANEAGGGIALPEALGGSGLKGLGVETQLSEAGSLRSVAGGGEGIGGVEGIIQKGFVSAGGGEELGFVAGKAFGAVGGLVDAGGEINSLIKTGGKDAFTRVDSATGLRVKESGLDKAGEITTEIGSVLDIASAFTGGLLVPLASAVTLAGAGLSAVGSIKDEKSDDAEVGITSKGKVDPSKAPKLSGGPISQAYTSLGFVGNLSHNPLANIA